MVQEAHSRAFTVAKATDGAVLQTLRDAVESAIKNGTSLSDFQKALEPKLKDLGWWGRQTVEGPNGQQEVQLGSPWRLKTIFTTNIASAANAGAWQEAWENREDRPYLQYKTLESACPICRPLRDKVFRIDDPFWDSFTPPNHFRCECWIITLDDDDIERLGLTVGKGADALSYVSKPVSDIGSGREVVRDVPVYTDPQDGTVVTGAPGFGYNPGGAPVVDFGAWTTASQFSPEIRDPFLDDMATSDVLIKTRELRLQRFAERAALGNVEGAQAGEMVETGWMGSQVMNFLAEKDVVPQTPVISFTGAGAAKHSTRPSKVAEGKTLDYFSSSRLFPAFSRTRMPCCGDSEGPRAPSMSWSATARCSRWSCRSTRG